jgi:hypothetical protein
MSFVANTTLAALVAAILLSVGLGHYDAPHVEAAMHPLSQSYELQWKDIKTARAKAIVTPKIVIAGSSGALFGLRCAVFTQELGAPCVNGALPSRPAFDDLIAFDRSLLLPGDVVLLQFDYGTYFAPARSDSRSQSAHLFRIDLDYLLTSVAERLMAGTGYSFFAPIQATLEGDRRGHTHDEAAQFADERAKGVVDPGAELPPVVVDPSTRAALTAFLAWAGDNRILAVGVLPPMYDDWPITEAWIQPIRQPYDAAGLPFVVLPNLTRYPRDCFWDSPVRLNEECQARHSKLLSEALLPILKERGYTFR